VRKRRIYSKVRSIARAFLAGESEPSEACLLLSPYASWNSELFSDEDKKLLTVVNSETDNLPVGRFRENWHPDFLSVKLEELAKYDAVIKSDVRNLCERLLVTAAWDKSKQEADEDS